MKTSNGLGSYALKGAGNSQSAESYRREHEITVTVSIRNCTHISVLCSVGFGLELDQPPMFPHFLLNLVFLKLENYVVFFYLVIGL